MAAATSRTRWSGESQMPTTRSPRIGVSASVIIPAGFVKLTSHASGAWRATATAMSRIGPSVRSANAIPPGPTVSWPSTPCASGTASSTIRPSRPPTRIAHSTNAAPRTAAARSVSCRRGSETPPSASIPASTASIVPSRAVSLSCRTTSLRPSRAWASSRARYVRGVRNPPAPMIVTRIRRHASQSPGHTARPMPVPILIDCDPGHDDAIAIMLALASPEVELRAVTAVSGNAPLHHTVANAIRVLDYAGRPDIPVAAGADRPLVQDPFTPGDVHGPTGLDGPDLPPPSREPAAAHAIDMIAEHVEASPEPLVLVPTGPLTNIALFAARYPEVAGRVGRVVLMGGATGFGNVTPNAEFNIWADPDAARP